MRNIHYTNLDQGSIVKIVPDLIRNRTLLRDLVWKELRARYRNAMMGFLWAVLQPVLMMLILTLVFGFLLGGMMTDRTGKSSHPYAVMLLCGLVPWQFLAVAIACGTNSLLESQELIKKVHFPREMIPLAAVANCIVNVVIGFVTLLVVMALLEPQGVAAISVGILYLPFIFAIQLVLIVGLVLFLSALNVHYRDVGYMVDVLLAFGFYATPIFYPLPRSFESLPISAGLADWLHRLYMMNPMANLVTAYREALLDNRLPDPMLLVRPAMVAVIVLVIGVCVFRRKAPTFADYL